jgi:hypothetical protein
VSCVCAGEGVSCIGNVLHPQCAPGVGCRCYGQVCNADKSNVCWTGQGGLFGCGCVNNGGPCPSDKHCCSDGTCKTSC